MRPVHLCVVELERNGKRRFQQAAFVSSPNQKRIVENAAKHPDRYRDEFVRFLEGCHMVVNVRRNKGRDIDAASGQLVARESRQGDMGA